MDLSIFLARIIGIVYVVVGLSVFLNAKYYQKLLPEVVKNTIWMLTMGLIGLVVCFIWVLKHNVWEGWPLLITLFGWIGLVKSAYMLLFPEWTKRMNLAFMKWVHVRAWWGGVGLFVGLLFSYFGFFA
ncbi:hypothetical protein JW752_02735 [Candidatus Peregrinibacteria bacterium]|nr:hypothetical protein [Candidatus Peregrinibacteria bacterium]